MGFIRNGRALSMHLGIRGMWLSALLSLALFDPGVATAREIEKEIKLTEKQIESFINIQKDLETLFRGVDPHEFALAPEDKPEKVELLSKVEAVPEKYGLSRDEFGDIMINIMHIMSGVDQRTKKFIDQPEQIKQELALLKADKSVPQAEKRGLLAQLEAALKDAKPVQFKDNIALVLKYFDELPTFTTLNKKSWCALQLRYLNCKCLRLQASNPERCTGPVP